MNSVSEVSLKEDMPSRGGQARFNGANKKMEKEFSKTKIIIAVVVGLAFLSMVTLFLLTIIRKPIGQTQDLSKQEIIPASTIESVDKQEEVVPQDQIEFADPGDDEVGREVKELDKLINGALPGEYNESDLSEELIEGEIELQ